MSRYTVAVQLEKNPIDQNIIDHPYVPDQPEEGTASVWVDLWAGKWKVRTNLTGWVAMFGPSQGGIEEAQDFTHLLAPSGNRMVALRYFSIDNRKHMRGFMQSDVNPNPTGNFFVGVNNVFKSYSYYWRKINPDEMTTYEKIEEMLYIAVDRYVVPELKAQLAGLVSAENLGVTGAIFTCFAVAGAMGFSLLIAAMKVLLGAVDVATNYEAYEAHWRLFYRHATRRTTEAGLEQGAEAIGLILGGLLAGHIGGKATEAALNPIGGAVNRGFPPDQFREKVLSVSPERWKSTGEKQLALEQQKASKAPELFESPLSGLQEDLRNGRISPDEFKKKVQAAERAAINTGNSGENICTKTWDERYTAYKKEAEHLQALENEAHRRGDQATENQIMLERLEVGIEAEALYGFVRETDGHARVVEMAAPILNCYLPMWKRMGTEGIRRLFATEGLKFADDEMAAFMADRDAITKPLDFTGHDKVGLAHKFLSIVAEGLKYRHKPSSKMSAGEWAKMVAQNPGAAKQALIMSFSQSLHNVFSNHHPPLGTAADFWEMGFDVVHARFQERCYAGSEALDAQKFGRDGPRERAAFIVAKFVMKRLINIHGEELVRKPQIKSKIEKPHLQGPASPKPKPIAVPVNASIAKDTVRAVRDKHTHEGQSKGPQPLPLPGVSYPVHQKKR
ncbi:MAG: hypothetical protein ABI972_15905 [Acidobacteriota bacterium]